MCALRFVYPQSRNLFISPPKTVGLSCSMLMFEVFWEWHCHKVMQDCHGESLSFLACFLSSSFGRQSSSMMNPLSGYSVACQGLKTHAKTEFLKTMLPFPIRDDFPRLWGSTSKKLYFFSSVISLPPICLLCSALRRRTTQIIPFPLKTWQAQCNTLSRPAA